MRSYNKLLEIHERIFTDIEYREEIRVKLRGNYLLVYRLVDSIRRQMKRKVREIPTIRYVIGNFKYLKCYT
jgi:hypothetical protein